MLKRSTESTIWQYHLVLAAFPEHELKALNVRKAWKAQVR